MQTTFRATGGVLPIRGRMLWRPPAASRLLECGDDFAHVRARIGTNCGFLLRRKYWRNGRDLARAVRHWDGRPGLTRHRGATQGGGLMAGADGSERVRRGAYATYVRLQWLLYELPRDHPSRQHLMLAVAAADRH